MVIVRVIPKFNDEKSEKQNCSSFTTSRKGNEWENFLRLSIHIFTLISGQTYSLCLDFIDL